MVGLGKDEERKALKTNTTHKHVRRQQIMFSGDGREGVSKPASQQASKPTITKHITQGSI